MGVVPWGRRRWGAHLAVAAAATDEVRGCTASLLHTVAAPAVQYWGEVSLGGVLAGRAWVSGPVGVGVVEVFGISVFARKLVAGVCGGRPGLAVVHGVVFALSVYVAPHRHHFQSHCEMQGPVDEMR